MNYKVSAKEGYNPAFTMSQKLKMQWSSFSNERRFYMMLCYKIRQIFCFEFLSLCARFINKKYPPLTWGALLCPKGHDTDKCSSTVLFQPPKVSSWWLYHLSALSN